MTRTAEIDAGDTRLHLREQGKGPAVVLLHGFPDTLATFDALAQTLASAGFRSVQVAMRGYAPGPVPPDGATFDALTLGRDVLRVIDYCGPPVAGVVGHDWGAVAAYSAACQAPDRIAQLITAAVPHPRRFLRPTLAQLQRSWYMGYFQLRGRPERELQQGDLIRRLWADWSPGLDADALHLDAVLDNFRDPRRVRSGLAYYRALPGTILRSLSAPERTLLHPIPVPTTVVAGAHDGCIGREMFGDQERLFSGGYRLEILPDAGHFMHLDQPQRFAEVVLDALG